MRGGRPRSCERSDPDALGESAGVMHPVHVGGNFTGASNILSPIRLHLLLDTCCVSRVLVSYPQNSYGSGCELTHTMPTWTPSSPSWKTMGPPSASRRHIEYAARSSR